jgi:hypothetical protein
MNEPAVAATCAAAYSIATKLSQSFARSKLAAWGSFGATALLSGGMSAAKEAARLERERAQHSREKDKGKVFDQKDMPRRQEMEKNRYMTREASDIQAKLAASLEEVKAGRLDASSLATIMADLTDLESRVRLGDEKSIDLVTYSSYGKVEQERTALDLARAELKVALRKAGTETLANKATTGTFDEYLDKMVTIHTDSLRGGQNGIEAKDKVFTRMKRSKAMKAFATTAVLGAVTGVGFQEVKAFFTSQDGLLEDGVKSLHDYFSNNAKWNTHLSGNTTALEGLHRFMSGAETHIPMGAGHDMVMGSTMMHLPEGVSIRPNADGTFMITQGNETLANNLHLKLGTDGTLDGGSITELGSHNIHVATSIVAGPSTAEVTESADDYVKHHPGATHKIHRELHYDNNTPNKVDMNEGRDVWGGVNSTGIDAHGNYVLNMKGMSPDGSYHGAASVDPQSKLPVHGLKRLFSLSRGTQHQVFEVPIDEHGNSIIEKDSELAKLMFETKNGHAVFTGQFSEVAQATGLADDGGENVRILSTVVGHGREMITHGGGATAPIVNVTFDIQKPWDYDIPPFIPITSRTPLERMKNGEIVPLEEINRIPVGITEVNAIPYYYTSGYVPTEERLKKYKESLSLTLKNDPDSQLDVGHETKSYLSRQEYGYVKELESSVSQMGPMNPECSTVICIPVAGHQEGDNIYATLKNYSYQTADPKTFEIVLFVNRPEVDKAGNAIVADKTLEEIERFKKDYPKMQIKVAEKVLPIKDANIGYIRKYLNDAVLLRNQERRSDMKDIVMVSNDADNKGLAPEYIDNFAKKFDSNQHVDAMLGQLDWDPDSYVRNPLVHIGTRLFQYIEIQSRLEGWYIGSSGANFAFRSSSYAAVGGYESGMGGGEDTDLGERIKRSRDGSTGRMPIAYAGARTSRLYTSSRRAEKALKDGLSPMEQWDQGFSAFDDEVRKVKWENEGKPVDFADNEQVKKLISNLETVINRTISRTKSWKGTAKDPVMARSLNLLGLKYEIVGDYEIRITDASKLIKGLESYQKDGLAIMNQKTSPKAVISKDKPEVKQDRASLLAAARKASEDAYDAPLKEDEPVVAAPVAAARAVVVPVVAPTAPRAPQAPKAASLEAGKERMEYTDISKNVRKALEVSFRKSGSSVRIEDLNVTVNDGSITVRGQLDASGLGGKPTIEVTLGVADGNKLVLKTTPIIKANWFVSSKIKTVVETLPERMMSVLTETFRNKKLTNIAFSAQEKTMKYTLS